jgi:hypothetical protein
MGGGVCGLGIANHLCFGYDTSHIVVIVVYQTFFCSILYR